jgi:hypothetical protein
MTKPNQKSSTSNADPMTAAMQNMAALNPLQGGALKAMFAMGTETLQFLSSRMQQDIETQQAMLNCKSLEDLQKVQSEFYTKALEDYRNAAAKMMGIMSSGGADSAPSSKRGYDDVPL